jgi:hypothetical protein
MPEPLFLKGSEGAFRQELPSTLSELASPWAVEPRLCIFIATMKEGQYPTTKTSTCGKPGHRFRITKPLLYR